MKKKRKLFFIHLGKLSNNSGHTARLRYELGELSRIADVTILSLAEEPDETYIRKHPNINFYTLPIKFNGWEVIGLKNTVKKIEKKIDSCDPDIVILSIEVWDLIQELNKKISRKVAFGVICHGMPFIGSPIKPGKSFIVGAKNFANMQTSNKIKNYIIKHYKELPDMSKRSILIANNKTVGYYFKNYFPKSLIWEQAPHVTVDPVKLSKDPELCYDFCYMARMEKGKGVEYLNDLFNKISINLGRKIKVAIMGRADDNHSQEELEKLLRSNSKSYSIHYYGWADKNTKTKVFGASGCFIYPSVYDNFPTVVNEALAHGLPVAMWNCPFYNMSYLNIKSISAATPFNIEELALNAVNLFKKRTRISHYSINYIKGAGSSASVAKDDLLLFNKMIDYHERSKK